MIYLSVRERSLQSNGTILSLCSALLLELEPN